MEVGRICSQNTRGHKNEESFGMATEDGKAQPRFDVRTFHVEYLCNTL